MFAATSPAYYDHQRVMAAVDATFSQQMWQKKRIA